MSANPSANMRVRISADINDIKQGLALVRGQLAAIKEEARTPLPRNNPIRELGQSAGQTAFAMRQLPMQFTDIFTGLATGQKPMMVLLQQGGQLKDVFGGVGAALKASATYLLGLVNPLTMSAAAVGGLALAWKSASDSQYEFDKAVIQTGGYAGKTSDDLRELVGEIDALEGVSRGSASEAVMKVATSGKFAGEQFDLVAASAARMKDAVGTSVDDTVDKFEELAKDPVKALLKLNESERFLTRAQYDRINALVEEGREQDAAAEAIRIYSERLDEVATQANAAMPAMSRWWRDVKDDITGAWGELQTYMGLLDRIIDRQGELRKSGGRGLSYSGTLATAATTALPGLDLLPDWASNPTLINALAKQWLGQKAGKPFAVQWEGAYAPGADVVDSGELDRKKELEEEWEKLKDRNQSKELRRQAEINEAKELGKKLGLEQIEIDKQIAAINEKYAEKKKKGLSDEQKASKAMHQQLESIANTYNKMIELSGDRSELAKLNYELEFGALKDLNDELVRTSKLFQTLKLDGQSITTADQAREYLRREARTTDAEADYEAIYGGYDRVVVKAEETKDLLTEYAKEAARNTQDALGESLYNILDGKFTDIGDSFADMLKRMAAELGASSFLKLLSQLASGVEGDNWWAKALRAFGSATTIEKNARGGVYATPGLSSFSGGVFDTPRVFAFAKGIGMFGEAGPEAIMPLRRDASGVLGVKAVGGVQPVINVSIEKGADRDSVEQTRGPGGSIDIKVMVRDAMRANIADGSLDGIAGQAWGVGRQGRR